MAAKLNLVTETSWRIPGRPQGSPNRAPGYSKLRVSGIPPAKRWAISRVGGFAARGAGK